MERNRPWLGIIAVALAGLALLFAIGGRFGPAFGPRYAYSQPAAQAQQAPGRGDQFGPGFHGRGGDQFGPGFHGRGGREDRGGFGFGRGLLFPFAVLFSLLDLLTKVAALGLLAWLLLRLYQQRRPSPATPAGPAPTTPAGHDPRVE